MVTLVEFFLTTETAKEEGECNKLAKRKVDGEKENHRPTSVPGQITISGSGKPEAQLGNNLLHLSLGLAL